MPETDAAETPAADDSSQDAAVAHVGLSGTKGKFIHGIRRKVLANVEDAGPEITTQAIHILRPIRFTAAD